MSERTRVAINLVLPEVSDVQDSCVQRLAGMLQATEGIEAAHVKSNDNRATGQMCIHFDPKRLSIGEVRALVTRAGAELELKYGHLLLNVKPMHARHARAIEFQVSRINGVLEAAVSPAGVMRIEFDREAVSEQTLQAALRKIDLVNVHDSVRDAPSAIPKAAPPRDKSGEHEHAGLFAEWTELAFAVICGVLLLAGWLLSKLQDTSPFISWVLYLAAYFFGGFFALRDAIENIRAYRLEIDLLMLVAAIGAATLGEWAEGALLLFLFSVGHALEHYAMGRAKRAIGLPHE